MDILKDLLRTGRDIIGDQLLPNIIYIGIMMPDRKGLPVSLKTNSYIQNSCGRIIVQ